MCCNLHMLTLQMAVHHDLKEGNSNDFELRAPVRFERAAPFGGWAPAELNQVSRLISTSFNLFPRPLADASTIVSSCCWLSDDDEGFDC